MALRLAAPGADHPPPDLPNHNGGQLQFHGRELFIGTGDGGAGGDPPNNAQNPTSCSASCCGSTRAGPRRDGPTRCRASNPFVGRPGPRRDLQLRPAQPLAVQHPGADGTTPGWLAIGDVGQSRFEEVDYLTASRGPGANFGWDAWEGFELYDCGGLTCLNDGTPDPGGTTKPIFAYDHSPGLRDHRRIRGPRPRAATSLPAATSTATTAAGDLRSFIPRHAGAATTSRSGSSSTPSAASARRSTAASTSARWTAPSTGSPPRRASGARARGRSGSRVWPAGPQTRSEKESDGGERHDDRGQDDRRSRRERAVMPHAASRSITRRPARSSPRSRRSLPKRSRRWSSGAVMRSPAGRRSASRAAAGS